LRVILVLPAGTFDRRRSEVEGSLVKVRDQIATRLQVTEDSEGAWTRTFGVSKTPSLYLFDAHRKLVWKHEGEPDAVEVAAALDDRLTPAPPPRARPLRLAVALGDTAPDFSFQQDRGDFALHRLRGREVLVNFWQSWSAPCLAELRRLKSVSEQRDAPFIVAFHGDADAKRIGAVRKELELSFAVVPDPDQRIARKYGVRCWPTTVRIDPQGRVKHVQFGISRPRGRTPDSPMPPR
jgi:peroxiredoxin